MRILKAMKMLLQSITFKNVIVRDLYVLNYLSKIFFYNIFDIHRLFQTNNYCYRHIIWYILPTKF